jgi:radical SAM superfamily enzyme YgiQ (UPF0313 family)
VGRILLIPPPCLGRGRLEPYFCYGVLSLQALSADFGELVDVLLLSEGPLAERTFASSEQLGRAVASQVDTENYSVVGLSTMGSSFHHTLNIARAIAEASPSTRIWLGGPQASVHPVELLEAFPWVEGIFVGEAEGTFRELLRRHARTGRFTLAGLAGVALRETPYVPRSPLSDLDSLPFIDRAPAFGAAVKAAEPLEGRDTVSVEVERGCPGRCTFCATRLFWGPRPRRKSDARLIEDMRRLSRAVDKKSFSFIGDNLASPHDSLLRLCRSLRQHAPSARWYAALKLDRLSVQDLDVLRESGCVGFFVGVESGSQKTLDRIRKGVDLARELEVIHAAIDRGFSIDASLIIGFPWETEEDVSATMQVHRDLLSRGVTRSMVSLLAPLPGTDITREYQDRIVPLQGFSTASVDGLAYGPATLEMMNRCPRSFTQLGYIEGQLSRISLGASLRVANLLSGYHSGRSRKPLTARSTP